MCLLEPELLIEKKKNFLINRIGRDCAKISDSSRSEQDLKYNGHTEDLPANSENPQLFDESKGSMPILMEDQDKRDKHRMVWIFP